MSLRIHHYIIFAFSISLVACSGSSEESTNGHTFQISDESGIPVALTTGGPKYQEDLFEFEEVLRLEQDVSREETILYRAWQYLMCDDGNYYVNDRGNTRIAVFGADGKYIRSFGRDGDGPGEFRYPNILWISGDILAVYDSRNRRTTLFNIDGTVLKILTHTSGVSISELHPISEDRRLIVGREMTPFVPGGEMTRTEVITIIDAEGDTTCTLTGPTDSQGRMIMLEEYGMGFTTSGYYSQATGADYIHDQGKILVYASDVPELSWYNLEGNLDSVIRIDMETPLVTDKDRSDIMQMLDDALESATSDQSVAMAKARKKHIVIPETKACWSSVLVDDLGFCWLGGNPDYGAEGDSRYRQPYMVLSPEGEYLGKSILPESSFNFSHGHLLTVHSNEETGEEELIVYRIHPAVEGLDYP